MAVSKRLTSKNVKIYRQSTTTDNYYATWAWKSSQSKIKITKNVYEGQDSNKKDIIKKKTITYGKAIEDYTYSWYYALSKKGSWYLDKTGNISSRSTKTELWTPPKEAVKVKFAVKPNSKTYKSGKNSTAKWFSGVKSTSREDKDYDEVPGAPSIGDFSIEKDTLTATVTYDIIYNDIDKVQVQVLKDGKTLLGTTSANEQPGNKTTGQNVFKLGTTGVGSYQVRARVGSVDSKKTIWSPYSGWSSSVDARPKAPTGATAIAYDEDKIKLTWKAAAGATGYQIEYVMDKTDYFNSSAIQTSTVENVTSYIISGLEAGHKYYFRIRSVNGSEMSEPCAVFPRDGAVLATKPAAPTTWSSTTNAVITSDINTTDPLYIYWTHNSKDGSVQRYAQLVFNIGGTNYYLIKQNTAKDPSGDLIDEITRLDFWKQTVYRNSDINNHTNSNPAGTIFSIFTKSSADSIKWKVRTQGLASSYSDFSMERVITAHVKPNLELTVTDRNGHALAGDILTEFPLWVRGLATPTSQSPISYYISITADATYDTTDTYGEDETIVRGSEVYSRFLDTNAQLDIQIGAADVDFVTEVKYTLHVVVYMDSGLTAEASYDFTPSWIETGATPNVDIAYDSEFRYTTLRPYCSTFIGYELDDEETEEEELYEPTVYFGTAMTGVFESPQIFADSGVSTAVIGDMYFNHSTGEAYTCNYGGNPSTATWIYRTTFNYGDAANWYSGTAINNAGSDGTYINSGIANAEINDYYLNTQTGDIFRCTKSGTPENAIWRYQWNCFWEATPDTTLSIYRKEQNGSYVAIAEGIDNTIQSSEDALFFRDPHPSFGICTYRVVSTDTKTGAIAFEDFEETYGETSVVIQWDEKWNDSNEDEDVFEGSILELPANIKLSDSNNKDVTLAEYIGRERPVSYYGTQQGETLKISCDFPKEDTETLAVLRKLMVYKGDVYIREPSGLGYWANVSVSYNRDYNNLIIPVSLDIKPVEGGM